MFGKESAPRELRVCEQRPWEWFTKDALLKRELKLTEITPGHCYLDISLSN